ncbi:MAG: septum formation initiator family protein [FCB group bacterium]|nr:septum formation initiator family protein [FCB group bacterium]
MPFPPKKSPFDAKAKVKIILIVILMGISFLFLNRNGMIRLFRAEQEYKSLIEKKEALERDKSGLESEKEKLLDDKKHIEKIAREQYNMVLPGEKVFKVIEE